MYRPNAGNTARIKHIGDLLDTIDTIVKDLPIEHRKKLLPLVTDLTDTTLSQVRPTKSKSYGKKWHETPDKACVFIVKWLQSQEDNRNPPEPLLCFTVADISNALGLAPVSVYDGCFHRNWYHKRTKTKDPRVPEFRAYESDVMVKWLDATDESEQLLIEHGFENRLDEIRKVWRKIP